MAGSLDGERERVGTVFAGYASDPARHRAWAADNAGNVAIRDELAAAILEVLERQDPGGTLLDVGCGTGWWLARLAQAGYAPARLAGVDILDQRVRAAQRRVPGASITAADARRLPVPDGSCALVTLLTVLSGLACGTDCDLALAEARRVLAPGGAIVVWEPRVATANRQTRLIRRGRLRSAMGPTTVVRSLTVAPPLARRAGAAYPLLAAVAPLRSHRLVVARPDAGWPSPAHPDR